MGEDVEKVTAPFEESAVGATAEAPATDGALALFGAGHVMPDPAGRVAENAAAWGLTIPADFQPATKAQVTYWRELCGAISATEKTGMRDGAWPAELAPSKPTLAAMVERRLIVRRGRAWRLKRTWYPLLQYLRLTAVATPPLTVAERPAPHLPMERQHHRDAQQRHRHLSHRFPGKPIHA